MSRPLTFTGEKDLLSVTLSTFPYSAYIILTVCLSMSEDTMTYFDSVYLGEFGDCAGQTPDLRVCGGKVGLRREALVICSAPL